MSWHRGGPERPVQLWPVGLVDASDVAIVRHTETDTGPATTNKVAATQAAGRMGESCEGQGRAGVREGGNIITFCATVRQL